MRKILLAVLLYSAASNLQAQVEFIRGIDISSLKVIEENNAKFFQDGQPVDALQLFKENGANYVRLRLWHTPEDSIYNLEYTLELAARVKEAELNLLLDIFYSDTWADPGKQYKPAAWEGLSFEDLNDSVFQYTADVLSEFKSRGLLPQMIQFGNEINAGMLWDDGRVSGGFNTESQWNNLAELIKSACNGAQAVLTPEDSVTIILQSATGGNMNGTQWFYDNLVDRDVNFDVIGLSYYPWWHGTLEELQANLNDAANRYSKEIIVVETAYPWTLDWNDDTHNPVGLENQLHDGYAATPEGQKQFLLDEIKIIKNTPNGLGAGWFYWEPAYITSDAGSPWENLAMFDFEGEVLPAIQVFNEIPTSVKDDEELVGSFELFQNYPNPFNPTTIIMFSIKTPPSLPPFSNERGERVRLEIYNSLGQKVKTLVNEYLPSGSHQIKFNGSGLPSGIYFYQLQVNDLIETHKMILLR